MLQSLVGWLNSNKIFTEKFDGHFFYESIQLFDQLLKKYARNFSKGHFHHPVVCSCCKYKCWITMCMMMMMICLIVPESVTELIGHGVV